MYHIKEDPRQKKSADLITYVLFSFFFQFTRNSRLIAPHSQPPRLPDYV